jgi:GTP-binding protein
MEHSKNRIIDAQFVAAAGKLDQLPPPQFQEIAFAGRSNVGKSTLMNALLGRRRLVRTSSTPGCTRTIGFFSARTADNTQLMLVDLPGYGYAQRSREERRGWAALIEGYLLQRPSLRGVVLLVDARRDIEADDQELLELLQRPPSSNRTTIGTILVATKLDEVQRSQQATRLRNLQLQTKHKVLGLSVLQLESVSKLWQELSRKWLSLPTGAPEQAEAKSRRS